MSLKSFNLNLLPVLRELLRTRSVSRTAAAIGRSPSAVSEALAQLRATFNDPLLVRVQGGLALTPRGLALIEPMEALWPGLEEFFAHEEFDSRAAKRMFVIAAHDFHVFCLGPGLLRLFHDTAPGLSIRFVDAGRELGSQLASRTVDFAIVPTFHLGDLASARLLHFPIRTDRTVVLMREGHALAKLDTLARKDLRQHDHVAFQPTWESEAYHRAQRAFRRGLPIRARVSQVTLLPFLLADTEMIALVPEMLAERLGSALGLVHRPLSDRPPDVRTVMAWSPILDADPAHRWFREQVRATLWDRDQPNGD